MENKFYELQRDFKIVSQLKKISEDKRDIKGIRVFDKWLRKIIAKSNPKKCNYLAVDPELAKQEKKQERFKENTRNFIDKYKSKLAQEKKSTN